MIHEEIRGNRVYHYSDAGMKLRKVETGALYDDVLDIIPCPWTYEETDIPVEDIDLPPEEALNIITGQGDE